LLGLAPDVTGEDLGIVERQEITPVASSTGSGLEALTTL
jgi:hypothetical protein